MSKPSIRFGVQETEKASSEWGFNCGPGALCAILNLTPDEIRPKLLGFEEKGYTNPTLMTGVLKGLGVAFAQVYRNDQPCALPFLAWGLMRIQWGGPWTKPGVPMKVRYRKTHWVAVADNYVFDVNAVNSGGWIPSHVWSLKLMPWLRESCCPEGDGTFWPTHGIEVLNMPDPALLLTHQNNSQRS